MLAAPLLTGALASGVRPLHAVLAVFWFTGYFAFFATGLWLKSRRRPINRAPAMAYSAAATVLAVLLVLLAPGLLRWVPLFVIPLGVGLWASATRHERGLLSGLSTTIGSSLMTVVAYDLGPGTDWPRAWFLAAVMAVYFAGTVLYVKTVIRQRGNQRYWWLSVGWHGVATLALSPVDPPLAVVFAALTARAAVVPRYRFSPKQIGIGEIVATVVVTIVALLTT